MNKLLLVDDEEQFRVSLQKHLELRGYTTVAIDNGGEAVKVVKGDPEIDVVILDRKMPGVSGEQVLKEIKEFRPELQVIFLTGHGTVTSAMEVGKYDAYAYLQKPCDFDELLLTIDKARKDKTLALEKHEIAHIEKGTTIKWLWGKHNYRPGIIIIGFLLFIGFILMPTPQLMKDILTSPKTAVAGDNILGYANYSKMKVGETIPDYYAKSFRIGEKSKDAEGKTTYKLSLDQAALRAKTELATLVVAALFWAFGAIPIGITALFVGVSMYFMGVFQPDDVAVAFAKDAVIFVFGVLAVARVISKTGLDRRIGLLLLGPVRSFPLYLFIFLPLIGIACSFLSEHALVAFIMPMLMLAYAASIQREGIAGDKNMAVMFVLSLCFAANCGGPGSPAAGGRNAVMVGILSDYGIAPTFGQWVKYGLPFVPVMALVIGLYFYLTMRKKIKVRQFDAANILKKASHKIGPMDRKEYITAILLAGLVFMWVAFSNVLGMGGPVLIILVLLNVFRILRWKDVASIPWEVVALYASACAMGKGLATTGAALYMAQGFVNMMPDFMKSGEGLAILASLFTGITTNFMSDGATVSAIGPITVPMAMISHTSPWMVGFATAFASSFAHTLLIGTPNNAIAYAMAKDPVTGEQLVTQWDFIRHGIVILLLSWGVLWLWTFFGYWRIIGFPQ